MDLKMEVIFLNKLKSFLFYALAISLFSLSFFSVFAQDLDKDPFKLKFNDEVREVLPGEKFSFDILFQVPKGYYLYDDKTQLQLKNLSSFKLLGQKRALAQNHMDPFSKKEMKVHFKDFTHQVNFQVPDSAKLGHKTLEFEVRYQGCSENLCYRPMKRTILLPFQVVSSKAKIESSEQRKTSSETSVSKSKNAESFFGEISRFGSSFYQMLSDPNPDFLFKQGKPYVLFFAFIGGILSAFLPCVLPIIPLTLAFVGAKRGAEKNLTRALMLYLGLVLSYAVLGVVAYLLGLQVGFLLQNPYFLLVVGLFFIIFALGMFGVIPFQLPASLNNRLSRAGGATHFGAILAGVVVGLLAFACVGPILIALFTLALQSKDFTYALLLMLNYSAGLGLPFLLLASGSGELLNKLKAGTWMNVLKASVGVLLLLVAVQFYLRPFYNSFQSRDSHLMSENHLSNKIKWVYEFDNGLKKARELKKPLIVDFYADWCLPCLELDKKTFSDQDVVSLSKEFVMLKVDCTENTDACSAATDKFQVFGFPTVMFLDDNGQKVEGVRHIGGFVGKDHMVNLMKETLEKVN